MTNLTENPVRIALVGLGGHGRTIQRAADEAAGLEVVAVYDPNPEEAALSAAHFGCDIAPSYEALVARDGLDAVSLCSPNFVHRAQAEAAFERGLDVFVEKPIANTVADGQAMMAAADAAGRVLMVGHNQRYGPALRWAKGVLEAGRLGTLVSLGFTFSSDTALRLPPASWRLRPEQCPLLPMMQLGIHAVDLVHYLAAPIASVSASARTITTPPGVIDSVAALFTLAGEEGMSGPHGTLVSSYCTPVHFAFRLDGTQGSLEGTPSSATFTPRGDGVGAELHDASADAYGSYVAQMEHFAEAVRARSAPETGAREGLAALAVIEAMTESIARGGAPVNLIDR